MANNSHKLHRLPKKKKVLKSFFRLIFLAEMSIVSYWELFKLCFIVIRRSSMNSGMNFVYPLKVR